MNLFPRQTIAQHVQLTIWKTMNTCQEFQVMSSWRSRYIATASLPNMELIDEADRSQAQALRYPVKNPAARPCFPLNTVDQ